jgi:hypothetical protein
MKLYDVIRKEQLTKKAAKKSEQPTVEMIAPPEYDGYAAPHKPFSWKKIGVIAAIILLVAGVYMLGVKLVRARVIVQERHIPFSIADLELDVAHEDQADAGTLSFQAMVVTSTVSREVFGSELSQSTTKAKGKAVIFNEYSKTPQTIKTGTVLTATNGKKYVTQATVSVPGFTQKGTVKTAGTATVAITASDVGESYNIDAANFTVSGWTGARAKQLYARSAGPLTGGEAGVRHTLSASERETVVATLQAQLVERLKRESRAQIPPDHVTFADLQVATIDPTSLKISGEGIKFPAELSGTMVSYLIPRDLLEQSIANKAISGDDFTDVTIPALGDITVKPVSALPTDPDRIPDMITIHLSGEGTVITKVPLETLRESLVGIERNIFAQKVSDIPEIDTARFMLYPFWAPLFPTDRTKIDIIID